MWSGDAARADEKIVLDNADRAEDLLAREIFVRREREDL
jgi:hypothetical protein